MLRFVTAAIIAATVIGCSETRKSEPRIYYRLPTAQEESQMRIAAAQERIAAAIEQDAIDRDRRRMIATFNEQNRKNGLGIPPIPNY